MKEHKQYNCVICGNSFISKNGNDKMFCSQQCRNKQRYKLKYARLHKDNKILTIDKLYKNRLNNICKELIKYGYEYISGYKNANSKIKVKCLKCGTIFEKGCETILQTYRGHRIDKKGNKRMNYIACPKCQKEKEQNKITLNRLLKEQEKRIKQQQARVKAKTKENDKIIYKWLKQNTIYIKVCDNCGKQFNTKNNCRKYCNNICAYRKVEYNHRTKRENRIKDNKYCNTNITLDKLIKRDNNKCYLCGLNCNSNDYYYKGNTFIAGNNYPSIDHIVPLSKGGRHTWKNVKLAHRYCNLIKRDKIILIPPTQKKYFNTLEATSEVGSQF